MGDVSNQKNYSRDWDVAHAFNSGIDEIKRITGEKSKLQSMSVSQNQVLDNLESAYDFSAERGHKIPRVSHVPSREAENYIKQGEISAQFEYLQSFDSLTGFLNERGAREEILQRVARVNRSDGGGFGIVVVDIKNFKYLNDALGQNGGDEVLRRITSTFRDSSRQEDSFWRIAGDEFAVLMDAENIRQMEVLIFQQRHDKRDGESISGWLDSVNRTVKSKLTDLVVGTKLEDADLGDAGEIRAGIFYVDKKVVEGFKGDDVVGSIMRLAKDQLEVVKEKQKSKLMIWKKAD